MNYEVRYQLGGEEHTDNVVAPDAASAAMSVQERYLDTPEVFELIQVHLMDEMPQHEFEADISK